MEKFEGYIYLIENHINAKLYVGQTINFDRRIKEHCQYPRLEASLVDRSIRKHGSNNFDFVLLESCSSQEELNKREIYWIKKLNTLSPHGYNLTQGGEGGIPCEEIRLKMSTKAKGRKHSEETKEKLRELNSGLNNPNWGKTASEEIRTKIGLVHKGVKNTNFGKFGSDHPRYGVKHTEDTKQKMSNKHKGKNNPFYGKTHSTETRLKMSLARKGYKNPRFGKSRSEETRKKISESLKRRFSELKELKENE